MLLTEGTWVSVDPSILGGGVLEQSRGYCTGMTVQVIDPNN